MLCISQNANRILKFLGQENRMKQKTPQCHHMSSRCTDLFKSEVLHIEKVYTATKNGRVKSDHRYKLLQIKGGIKQISISQHKKGKID